MGNKRDKDLRPLALVIAAEAWMPGDDPELRSSVRDDLVEVIQFLRMKLETSPSDANVAQIIGAHDAPCVVTFDDVPGLPMEALEGAVSELEGADVVVGPCADGSVYLLGFNEDIPGELAQELTGGAIESLPALVDVIEKNELEPVALPPWFRLRSAKDLSFAQALTRLSLQSEDGDMDFLADRLKNWFSQKANG